MEVDQLHVSSESLLFLIASVLRTGARSPLLETAEQGALQYWEGTFSRLA